MNDLTQVIIRGLIGFFLMFILARIMGKKHITQITYYEYIVGISIGSIAAELTFGTDTRISNYVFGMILWAILPILLSKGELKSYTIRKLLEGKPTILIKDGKVLEKNLKKESVSVDELMIYLRKKDVFKVTDVELATMETNGEITIMKKSNLQPVTPKDVGLVVEMEHQPHVVIVDGNLMSKSLSQTKFSEEWLLGEVRKQGAKDFQDVFLAQVDSMGNVYVDLYNDHAKIPQMKQKLLAAANIKQLQSSLVTFSLQTENQEAKKMYQQYAKQMDDLMHQMSVYLKE